MNNITTQHYVTIGLNANAFIGLARQNLDFPHSVFELCDNAIAAAKPDEKALIRIHLMRHPIDKTRIVLTVADWGKGMNLDALKQALQLGAPSASASRLNEHGFGLKNALAVLSGGNSFWTFITSDESMSTYLVAHGPFVPQMEVEERQDLTDVLLEGTCPWNGASTVIQVAVPLQYARTVQSRGGRLSDCATLRSWLVEHLGVTYHSLLEQTPQTMEPRLKISITVGNDEVWVPPVRVPMRVLQSHVLEMELGGQMVKMLYRYGSLDIENREHLIRTSEGETRAKCYYQGNIPTQGIQIEVGGRVLATGLLSEIWRKANGEPVVRHNHYNEFVGELVIPDLPRGVLSTLNNKSSFDPNDQDWIDIFEKLAEYEPVKNATKNTEERLKRKWMDTLRAACPQDTVSDERSVWPTGTRIDVVDEAPGKLDIYEIKAPKAEPQHLYQLKMYWDGLVLEGKQPTCGVLIAQKYSSEILAMVEMMNRLPSPKFPDGRDSMPYNLKVVTLKDKNLD